MKKQYSLYTLKNGDVRAETLFFPSDKVPVGIPISTPLTFPFQDSKVYLCLDKTGWWNPLGGHINKGETWQEAVTREAREEAGVIINDIRTVGHIHVRHSTNTIDPKHPPESIIPITVSKVVKYLSNWKKHETRERGIFTPKEAVELFKKRQDNNQMLEIFKYVINNYQKRREWVDRKSTTP